MASALVTTDDVEVALMRPLSTTESGYGDALCDKATALLRAAMPTIDTRVAAFKVVPLASSAVSPDLVAAVLADVIKRVLVNPKGLSSASEGTGPYTRSETFAGVRGEGAGDASGMAVTSADLARINGSVRPSGIGMIQLAPTAAMQPRSGYRRGYDYDWFRDPQ